jgi:hypothetical protein
MQFDFATSGTKVCKVQVNLMPGTVYSPQVWASPDKKKAKQGAFECALHPWAKNTN